MSFFDDEPDEPTRAQRAPRPRAQAGERRPSGPATARPRPAGGGGGGGGSRPASPDVQARRLVAAGAGFVLLLVLVFGARSCMSSRQERAFKDYNREVGALAVASVEEVSTPFFELLGQGADQSRDLRAQVIQLRLTAQQHVDQAETLDVPDEMARAQTNLTLALNFRAEGLNQVAERVDDALVTGRDNAQTAEDAVQLIAGQMQAFLASDVIWSQRVAPEIRNALGDADIEGQRVQSSRFLPSIEWLSPNTVAERLGSIRAGGGQGASTEPAPGLHGHGLTSVAVGATTLQPGTAVNRIAAGANPSFTVKFANQGDNDESDVGVTIRIRTGGGQAQTARKTVNQTKAGQESTVSIPLTRAPTIGQSVTIEVAIEGVPGEKKTDNNRQSYVAVFTR